ncbi:MAG: hypothetical protein IKA36_06515, partial [Clostridia bacterium]|nr:hypothetical protein [Clostridia bacterium]
MKTITKTIKYTIFITIAMLLILLSGIGLFQIQNRQFKTEAAMQATNITISNANFNSSPSTSYPFSPSSFKSSASASEYGVEAGVISLKKYNFSQNSTDDYALMIKSNSPTYFGYTTSSSISLKANSYYMISVDVMTSNLGKANLELIQNSDKYSSMTGITSENVWTTCTFLIKTNENSDSNVNIGMFLNGNGTVLFDNLAAVQLNYEAFETIHDNLDNNNEKHLDVNKTDASLNSYNMSDLFPSDISYDTVANDSVVANSVVLKDSTGAYITRETKEDFLTIKQNKIYRVSVFAKTVNLNGKATLQLIETGNNEANSTDTLSITSNTTSALFNNFQRYDFYIKGYPDRDTTYQLKFSLGDTENYNTTGELYISRVVTYSANTSTFSSISTSSTVTKKDLTTDFTNVSSFMVNNGNFNNFEYEDVNKQFPATAKDFTVVTGKNDQYHGIINTRDFTGLNDMNNFINPHDPRDASNKGNNNVLMMYNHSKDTLSYESSSKTLSANTYHRFNLKVQTQGSTANIALVSNGTVIAEKNITTGTQVWEDVNFYIYSGNQSIDIAVKITLTTESYGYTYVDDIYYDLATDLAQYDYDIKSAYEAQPDDEKIDLSDLLANKNYMGATNSENITTEIIDLNNSSIIVDDNFKSIFENINKNNKNALLIRATGDTEYTITSKLGFALTANEYYKLSLSVYNQKRSTNLVADDKLATLDISLTNFEDSFVKVNSYNEWTTYNFYICPTETTTTHLTFKLVSKEESILSDTIIANIEFKNKDNGFDESAFESNAEANVIKLKKVVEETEETTQESNNKADNKNLWLYILPSIAFAVIIVAAVIVFILKKVKWKKPSKKVKTDYARDKNFSHQVYLRKATALREQQTIEMKKSLDSLLEERAQFEDEYKTTIAKVRELKIKRGDVNEIARLEKELNKNRKSSSHVGVKINKLQEDLDFMKTDVYLNSLAKKLAKHKIDKEESK